MTISGETVIDVVIPTRNEQDTIGSVIRAFKQTRGIGRIIVADNLSVDYTVAVALDEGALVMIEAQQGKGQAVKCGLQLVTTSQVILCDGDLHGLTPYDVFALKESGITIIDMEVIAVPAFTKNVPWAEPNEDWKWLSGCRRLPTALVRSLNLHGYAMEMQINQAVKDAGIPVEHIQWEGVTGTPKELNLRIADMLRDWEWIKKQQ